jgi:hypothetical protein
MKCDSFQSLILEYLDGTLLNEQTQKIEKHISWCSSCQILKEQFRSALNLTSDLSVTYPNRAIWDNFSTDLLSRITSEHILKKDVAVNSWSKILRIGWRVAACLLLATSMFIYHHKQKWKQSSVNVLERVSQPVSISIPNIGIVIKEIENVLVQADVDEDILAENFEYSESLVYINDSNELSDTTIDSIENIIATLSREAEVDEDTDFSTVGIASLY